jgi:catechol 2,3-dioxygenase-like lactoylglutathione lyase family enzyme
MALHRLLSVTLGVPDVAAAATFYRDFGLTEARPGVLATTAGGEQLRLEPSPYRRLVELAVAVDDAGDLERIARNLAALDVPSTRDGATLTTRDRGSGVAVRLAAAPRLRVAPEPRLPLNGPGRVERSGRSPALADGGARPRRLGHVVLATPDLEASHEFFVRGVGFKESDAIGGLAWFLRCSTDHHNLLIQRAPVAFLHHTAWEVGDADEIGRGAREVLAADPSRHAWGLGRHHVGSNFFWYFRDPAGHFAEYYSDLDVIPEDADWTPQTWDGRAGLYAWGPAPPTSFLVPDDLGDLMSAAG